jgi:hypothetical protein
MTALTKIEILRPLDPQPEDGSGPGFISAADIKKVVGDLYDTFAAAPSTGDQLAILEYYVTAQRKITGELIRTFTDANGQPRTGLSTDEVVARLVHVLSAYRNPSAPFLERGEGAAYSSLGALNADRRSNFPTNWATMDPSWTATLDLAGVPTTVWWNGVAFEIVDPAGAPETGQYKGDPTALEDGDIFQCVDVDLVDLKVLHGAGFQGGVTNAPFTVKDVTGASKAFLWTGTHIELDI